MPTSPDSDTPSLIERIDPGGLTREQIKRGTAATSPLGASMLRLLGVPRDRIDALKEAIHACRHLDRLDETTRTLTENGWAHCELAPGEAGHRAAQLFRAGRAREADELMVAAWTGEDEALFRLAKHRIFSMYWSGEEDDEPSTLGAERARLIDEAIELHRTEKYAGAIPIVLAQADGIVADWSEDRKGLFRRNWDGTPAAKVVDETTMAGHPDVLLAFSLLLTERIDETQVNGDLARHGILHGRELGYDTLVNSTKAFAGLLAVVVWAQARAQARLSAEAAEQEARHAGSTERDENGRRLDRRGISAAKASLWELALLQDLHWGSHGGYSDDISTLDPPQLFPNASNPSVSVSADRRLYWAWLESQAGYILGLGRRAGDDELWYFGGDAPPQCPPPDGWHHGSHPDW